MFNIVAYEFKIVLVEQSLQPGSCVAQVAREQFLMGPNDMMHSYLGRSLLSRMNYEDFIGYLKTMMPDYMQAYRASGLLPDMANNNSVHVNEKIIPNVAAGLIKVKPLAERFTGEGAIEFVDASQEKYDVIITSTDHEDDCNVGSSLPAAVWFAYSADRKREHP